MSGEKKWTSMKGEKWSGGGGIRSSFLPPQEMRLELTSAFCLPSFLPQELDGKKGMFLLKPDRSRTDMTSSGSLFMQKNATIVRRLLGLKK